MDCGPSSSDGSRPTVAGADGGDSSHPIELSKPFCTAPFPPWLALPPELAFVPPPGVLQTAMCRALGVSRAGVALYEIRFLADGPSFALKCRRSGADADADADAAELVREAALLRKNRFEYTMCLHGVWAFEMPGERGTSVVALGLVTEFVSGGSLATLAPGPSDDKTALFEQLAGALAVVHSNGMLHQDVRPESVLLTATTPREVRLDGFGEAADVHARRRASPNTAYSAPEVLADDDAVSVAADIFSLGATLFESLTGRRLFADGLVAARRLEPSLMPRVDLPSGTAPIVRELVLACLHVEPALRPSAAQIVQQLHQLRGLTARVPETSRTLVFVLQGEQAALRRQLAQAGSDPLARMRAAFAFNLGPTRVAMGDANANCVAVRALATSILDELVTAYVLPLQIAAFSERLAAECTDANSRRWLASDLARLHGRAESSFGYADKPTRADLDEGLARLTGPRGRDAAFETWRGEYRVGAAHLFEVVASLGFDELALQLRAACYQTDGDALRAVSETEVRTLLRLGDRALGGLSSFNADGAYKQCGLRAVLVAVAAEALAGRHRLSRETRDEAISAAQRAAQVCAETLLVRRPLVGDERVLSLVADRALLSYIRYRAFELESHGESNAVLPDAAFVAECDRALGAAGQASDAHARMGALVAVFVARLFSDASQLVGPAPCAFAVVGLGSFAYGEMCPFSDLDAVLLVADASAETHGYFLRLARLVELRIAALGETPCDLAPGYESPLSCDGFRLDDGMLSPARTISTPKDLAAWQQVARDGLRSSLVDPVPHALRTAAFMCGDLGLYAQYRQAVGTWLWAAESESGANAYIRQTYALRTLAANRDAFAPTAAVAALRGGSQSLHLKHDVCRFLTLMVDGFSLFFDVRALATRARLIELGQRGLLHADLAALLLDAWEFVFGLRVRLHIAAGRESAKVRVDELSEADRTALGRFVFTALWPLQRIVQTFCTNQGAAAEGESSAFGSLRPFLDARWHWKLRSIASPVREAADVSAQPLDAVNLSEFGDGAFVCARDQGVLRLSASALADLRNEACREQTYGRARVVRVCNAFHFKFAPELPHLELAVHFLGLALFGYDLTAQVDVARLWLDGDAHTVLLSETVEGGVVLRDALAVTGAVDQVPLDARCFCEQAVLALLTNPEDGKTDNVIYVPRLRRLVPIDNDHAFVEPMAKTGRGPFRQRCPRVKTIMFCLDGLPDGLQGSVDSAVRERLRSLRPFNVIWSWASRLLELGVRVPQLEFKSGVAAVLFHKLCALHRAAETRGALSLGMLLGATQPPELVAAYVTAAAAHAGASERFAAVSAGQYKSSLGGALVTQTPMRDVLGEQHTAADVRGGSGAASSARRSADVNMSQFALEVLSLADDEVRRVCEAIAAARDGRAVIKRLAQVQSVYVAEHVVEQVDFGSLSVSMAKAVLRGFRNVHLTKLVLRRCAADALNNASLARLMRAAGTRASLARLELANCDGVASVVVPSCVRELRLDTLPHLALITLAEPPTLEALVLVDCSALECCGQGGAAAGALVVPLSLLELRMSGASRITRVICCDAPAALLTVELRGCPELRAIALGPCRRLVRVAVHECPRLDDVRRVASVALETDASGIADLAAQADTTQIFGLCDPQGNFRSEDETAVLGVWVSDALSWVQSGATIRPRGALIGSSGARALAAVLLGSSVTRLDLTKNAIGDDGLSALAAALPGTLITRLELMHNDVGAAGARALAAVLPRTLVALLDLAHNQIGVEGVHALAAALPGTSITSLNLTKNDIETAGARALAATLQVASIKSLNLTSNRLGNDGARALAAVLTGTVILSMDLMNNDIGDDGACALAAALDGAVMTSLDLMDNDIAHDGACALAQALPRTSLTSLDMSSNRVGDDAARALAASLPGTSILSLGLLRNGISDETMSGVALALRLHVHARAAGAAM